MRFGKTYTRLTDRLWQQLSRELYSQWWTIPATQMWTEYSQHIDVPDKTIRVTTTGFRTEMEVWDDKRTRNRDIPDNLAYYDMGIEQRRNTHLDSHKITTMTAHGPIEQQVNTLNDRHFREQCVIYGNRAHAVYEKASVDLEPPVYLQAEWLMEKLNCQYIDATTVAESLKRLGLDKTMALKAIFGYVTSDGEVRDGLQNVGESGGREYAQYFEQLCNDVKELDEYELERQFWLDVSNEMITTGDWTLNQYDRLLDEGYDLEALHYYNYTPSPVEQLAWVDEQVANADLSIHDQDEPDDDCYVSVFGDHEIEAAQDAFGVFPLQDDSSGLAHDMIVEIKEASVTQVRELQQKMFPQWRHNQWGSRKYPAQFGWMSKAQKDQFWKFMNARKEVLQKSARKALTIHSEEVVALLKTIDYKSQRRALVASYCAGNPFNLYGESIKFDHKPCELETYAIWGIYRELEAK